MNPILFGREAWNFFHQLPWIFNNEILNENDLSEFFNILFFTLKLLPCKTCCQDSQNLLKKLNIVKNLGLRIGKTANKNNENNENNLNNENDESDEKIIVTRSCLAELVFNLHTMVNEKLKKKVFSTDWKSSVKNRPDWIESFLKLLTIFAWNFPSSEDWKKSSRTDGEYSSKYLYDRNQVLFYYKFYFTSIVPLVLSKAGLSK